MTEGAMAILVVDDEPAVRDSLQKWLQMDGHRVEVAQDAQSALRLLRGQRYDVALVDLKMPGMDGVELQYRMQELLPEMAVVIITAYASVETAVEVLKNGAFDYLTKPVDPDELSRVVGRAARRSAVRIPTTKEQLERTIVGQVPAMQQVREQVVLAAASDLSVVICGEQGTGRRLVAGAIHANSARRLLSLQLLHCEALDAGSLAEQLFGRESSGGGSADRGRLEHTVDGTLIIHRMELLDQTMQATLLDLLQTRSYQRVGSTRARPLETRLIFTSDVPLEALVDEGRLRHDLFYRINLFRFDLPALRDRRSDIPLLARAFVAQQLGGRAHAFDPQALQQLSAAPWPGNVAQLKNAVERAQLRARGERIEPGDLELPRVDPAGPVS